MSGQNEPLVGLRIIAPPSYASIPVAMATCRCGAHRHARGKDAVLALIEAYTAHRATCTGQPAQPGVADTDRRTAA